MYKVELLFAVSDRGTGAEYYRSVKKRIKFKPVLKGKGNEGEDYWDWLESATYTVPTQQAVKQIIQAALKAAHNFYWGGKNNDIPMDHRITFDDETREFYPGGEYTTPTKDKSDEEIFITISKPGMKIKQNPTRPNYNEKKDQIDIVKSFWG
jgi:hypothetical protein